MSLSVRNQTSGALERVAGFNDTDSILSPSSKNPISNKAVYNALLQKIDKTVTDLINYYDKSQVYTKPEVRALIGAINTLTIEVVAQLPTSEISTTTIYFVGPAPGTNNYDEYVYVGGNWVQIGDTTIDLSNYVTSANLTTVLQDYYTKSEADALFDDYYNKDAVDDLLDTKQDTLTFDNDPTLGSQNPVTSNGIRTAISNAIISSAGGSIIKIHHLDGGTVVGDTVTASKGSFSVSTTFDNNGDAIIIGVGEIGTIQITATNGTDVGVAFINTPSFSLYSTTISYGVNYKSWVETGGLNPSSYSSLDEVLEDEEAIRRLFTIHASVNYLTTAIITDDNEDAIKIFNNDLCAKWISLRDYAMDTLPTNEYIATMMEDADKYGYGEWTIMPQVPVMINNTLPYGEAFASSEWGSGYEAYKAFNKDSSSSNSGWESVAQSSIDIPSWVAYDFVNPIKIIRATFQVYANNLKQTTCDAYIEGSNDKTNWIRVSEPVIITTDSAAKDYSIEVNTNTAYRYYRLYYTKTFIKSQGGNVYFAEAKLLQFYAWQPKGNIPNMTSNTAPYGECFGSSNYPSNPTSTFYNPFKWEIYGQARSNDIWMTAANDSNKYIGYKFTNPTKVKRVCIGGRTGQWYQIKTFDFYGSNDGSTWTSLGSYETGINWTTNPCVFININNDDYYMQYKIQVTSSYGNESGQQAGAFASAIFLQFYGREMKVSVPDMTNNTTPYGEASANDYASGYYPYLAFTDTASSQGFTSWGSGTAQWIGYEFPRPVIIKKFYIKNHYYSNSYERGYVQAFVDNKWINISTEVYALGTNAFMFDIENIDNIQAKRIRFKIDSCQYSSTVGMAYIDRIQFFGFDYSERDWDTEHPMKYIYDHGCLKDFTYTQTYETSSSRLNGVVISHPDSEEYKYTSGSVLSDTTWFFIDKQIDMSQYSKVFINYLAYGGKYNGLFAVCANKVANPSYLASIACPMNTKDITAIDISSVNTNGYITVGIHNDDIYCSEFWLE